MFRKEYKKAYDKIRPNQEQVDKLLEKAGEQRGQTSRNRSWKPAAAAIVCFICIWSAIPVCAANIPAFYKVIESISPEIADLFVPVEKSSSSQGVVMQVEAVNLDGKQAEIIVSFRDEEGFDHINGRVDPFDSYGLDSSTGSSQIAGCSFIRYDPGEDKAYFMISVETEDTFGKDKLTFYVRSLLCGITKEEKDIDLSAYKYGNDIKNVIVNGCGGTGDITKYTEILRGEGVEGDPRKTFRVLNTEQGEAPDADGFTVTGVTYQDEILRVQICMGDNTEGDRHVQPFLIDRSGAERYEDYSVSWDEQIGDRDLTYYEYYFFGPFDRLEDYSMYGIFHNSGEMIEGEWNVSFRLEQ